MTARPGTRSQCPLRPGRSLVVALLLGASIAGCANAPTPQEGPRYRPDRRDYATFRAAHDDLLEPNYLPFMLHRLPGDDVQGDPLVFCRWPDARMPLRVFIAPPQIPERLQDEFALRDPRDYVLAVRRALAIWESEMEGLVRFELREREAGSDLRFRILGEEAPSPEPEIRVLGSTPAILDACHPDGWQRDADALRVSFDVPEVELYAADEHGLLLPRQIEQVALHEIGHALGMKGHSPFPENLMYRAVRDRAGVHGLSEEDANSFVSLYRLPNGTRFGDAAPGTPTPPPPPGPPTGAPKLAPAPHVDSRLGFSLRVPEGWLRLETPHGLLTANGPLWDHDAALALMIRRADSLEAFLARYERVLLHGTWLRSRGPLTAFGRPGVRIRVEDGDGQRAQEFWFVELPAGRVLMLLAEAPAAFEDEWRPWFAAAIASLELWPTER